MSTITTVEQLAAIYGEPVEASIIKEVDQVTPHYRAMIEASPFALLASPSLPVTSVGGLIKLARSKPGELTYGSSGVGGTPHRVTEMFTSMSNIKMRQIPYKGTAQALSDVVAGRVVSPAVIVVR